MQGHRDAPAPSQGDPSAPLYLAPDSLPDLAGQDAELLRLLVEVSNTSGSECERAIVRGLARALRVPYAVLAEFDVPTDTARPIAFWSVDRFADAPPWTLRGTPCQRVIGGELCQYPSGVRERFPEDKDLAALGAESYLGIPLRARDGRVLGHLFVMDRGPMPSVPRNLAILRIFAGRAAAELERLRLERTLKEGEENLRDLFDEAPIAYVHEGLDTRFIRANRAALRALGITPEQVEGTYGKSLVVDNPGNQERLKAAFESVGRGTDTAGVVLELRRRDTGAPLWIQWWSKPDRDGKTTRTMFIDITQRVLAEQARERLEAQNRVLVEELNAAQNFGDIVGTSPALRKVLDGVERVAPTDSTVLIMGETGTGKELVARAVHERSARRHAPFVKVNCAALPAGLVESEFFGHEKGAFTGATATRRGRFELADGGTIFLDEVGEVSPEVQVKLLRVLQESEFERVGGSQTIRVSVRVIAATNRDLAREVEAQRFRADLFFRLSVFPIRVPALRDRADDIPLLASYFTTQLSRSMGREVTGIDPGTLARLRAYAWPGNIRELRNVIERALILGQGPTLVVAAEELGATREQAGKALGTLEDAERAHILAALEACDGAVGGERGAAKLLGVPPSTLRSMMARLGVKA